MEPFKFLKKLGSKYKIIELFIAGIHYVVFCSFPQLSSFVYKKNLLSYAHHRVHIVRV